VHRRACYMPPTLQLSAFQLRARLASALYATNIAFSLCLVYLSSAANGFEWQAGCNGEYACCGGTHGPCRNPSDGKCAAYVSRENEQCPSGHIKCGSLVCSAECTNKVGICRYNLFSYNSSLPEPLAPASEWKQWMAGKWPMCGSGLESAVYVVDETESAFPCSRCRGEFLDCTPPEFQGCPTQCTTMQQQQFDTACARGRGDPSYAALRSNSTTTSDQPPACMLANKTLLGNNKSYELYSDDIWTDRWSGICTALPLGESKECPTGFRTCQDFVPVTRENKKNRVKGLLDWVDTAADTNDDCDREGVYRGTMCGCVAEDDNSAYLCNECKIEGGLCLSYVTSGNTTPTDCITGRESFGGLSCNEIVAKIEWLHPTPSQRTAPLPKTPFQCAPAWGSESKARAVPGTVVGVLLVLGLGIGLVIYIIRHRSKQERAAWADGGGHGTNKRLAQREGSALGTNSFDNPAFQHDRNVYVAPKAPSSPTRPPINLTNTGYAGYGDGEEDCTI
jgi:hypothetical protein